MREGERERGREGEREGIVLCSLSMAMRETREGKGREGERERGHERGRGGTFTPSMSPSRRFTGAFFKLAVVDPVFFFPCLLDPSF